MDIAVFGIGNILLSDDGVGVHTLNRLKEEYDLPGYVELIDGGTKGLDLLPLLEDRDKVLIIDAANFNRKPGTIDAVEGDKIPAFLSTKLSVHQIGLPDLLFAAKPYLQYHFPFSSLWSDNGELRLLHFCITRLLTHSSKHHVLMMNGSPVLLNGQNIQCSDSLFA